jgi:hypothetical protein
MQNIIPHTYSLLLVSLLGFLHNGGMDGQKVLRCTGLRHWVAFLRHAWISLLRGALWSLETLYIM